MVRWTPDGAIVADERARIDPDSGRSVGLAGSHGSFSPSGERLAWVDLGQLHWGFVGGVSHLVEVERWIDGDPDVAPDMIAAWIDEHRLYVHQIDTGLVYRAQLDATTAEACRVLDVRDGAWSAPAGCLRGDLLELYRVQFAGGLALVESVGEGHPALDVLAWDPGGPRDVGFPDFDLYPFGPVDASFRPDGSVDLLTPCRLELASPPCQGPDGEDRGEEPWRHYRWRLGDLEPQLIRDGLPRFAAPDPLGDRYAWPTERAIYVGDPVRGRAATRVPL